MVVPWTREDVQQSLDSVDGEADEEDAGDSTFTADQVDVEEGRKALLSFLETDEDGFRSMWDRLSLDDRRNFIRTVCPHMPISPSDPQCACRQCGQRSGELRLIPEFTVEGLVGGPEAGPKVWPECNGPTDLENLPRLMVSGELPSVFLWHACKSQWEHDKRDLHHVYRLMRSGSLPNFSEPPRDGLVIFCGSSATPQFNRGQSYKTRDKSQLRKSIAEKSFCTPEAWDHVQKRQIRILQILSLLADEYRTEWAESHGGMSVSSWFTNASLSPSKKEAAKSGLSEAAIVGLHYRQISEAMQLQRAGEADPTPALALKERGNALFAQGDFAGAREAYTGAITTLHAESDSDDAMPDEAYALLVTCLSNRAESLLRMRRGRAAQEDCRYAPTLAGVFHREGPARRACSSGVVRETPAQV